jgi:hypothetical protein
MSEINDFLNEVYGDIIYNGKTIAVIKLNGPHSIRNVNPELYRKLRGSSSYDTIIMVLSKQFIDYSVVIKSEPGKKTSLFNYGNGVKINFDDLFNRFPEVKKKISIPDLGFPNLKSLIYRFCNNDYVSTDMILQEEPLITKIVENKIKKGKSLVYLKFDNNEDYWYLFGYKDYDINFMSSIFSSYSSSIINSSDYANSEWSEGYFLYTFNIENLKKIKKILSYTNPDLNETLIIDANGRYDFDDTEAKKILKFLYDNFSRKCDDIVDKWAELNDEAHTNEYEEIIEKENSDYFEQYGIIEETSFYKYYAPMQTILKLFDEVPNSDYMSLYEVLSELGDKLDKSEDFMEEVYSNGLQAQHFDDKTYNIYCGEKLDEIIDEIEDEWDFANKDEYFKILSYLKKLNYQTDVKYPHPTKKDRTFRIFGVNPSTNKIKLFLTMGNKNANQEFSVDEFNNYLYHPELFDSIKFGKKKI